VARWKYTIIVSAGSSEPAALSYIAPYTGVSIAEYFMEQGKRCFNIYDEFVQARCRLS